MGLHAIQELLKKQRLVEGVIRSQQHTSHPVHLSVVFAADENCVTLLWRDCLRPPR